MKKSEVNTASTVNSEYHIILAHTYAIDIIGMIERDVNGALRWKGEVIEFIYLSSASNISKMKYHAVKYMLIRSK